MCVHKSQCVLCTVEIESSFQLVMSPLFTDIVLFSMFIPALVELEDLILRYMLRNGRKLCMNHRPHKPHLSRNQSQRIVLLHHLLMWCVTCGLLCCIILCVCDLLSATSDMQVICMVSVFKCNIIEQFGPLGPVFPGVYTV